MTAVSAVGLRVGRLRSEKGWTQEMLAAKVQLQGGHMTRAMVANIECLRSSVNEAQILELAHALDVKAGDLFCDGLGPRPFSKERRLL